MKLDKSAFISGEKLEVVVPNGEQPLTLYVQQLSYFSILNVYSKRSDNVNTTAVLLLESVTDKDGNKFTIEEVMNLKKEVAEPLIEAALKVNSLGDTEKN